MKLHDFIVKQPSDDFQKLRDLGKALVQPFPLRVSEVTKKPVIKPRMVDTDDDGGINSMDAAIAVLTADHKLVRNKMKNYD